MSSAETTIMTLANYTPNTVDSIVRKLFNNKLIESYFSRKIKNLSKTIHKLERVLVVSDTNIGDAIVLQPVVQNLKYYFPDCSIDYAYQQKAHNLLKNNPFIDTNHPVFVDSDFTSYKNSIAIEQIVKDTKYDLIINLYPFFSNGALKNADCPIILPIPLVANIVKAESANRHPAHVLFQSYRYINDLCNYLPTKKQRNKSIFKGNKIYLTSDVLSKSDNILKSLGISAPAKFAMINPDSSSKFTRIPINFQVELIEELLKMKYFNFILISPGFTFPDIEKKIADKIPSSSFKRDKLKLIPRNIEIDEYTGIVDRSTLFITGDTAQLHISAAFKECIDASKKFQNNTAIINIFGATNSKVYGYDSFSEKHLDSNQNADAKVFEAMPGCKNLTCIHKTRKNCDDILCFQGIKIKQIVNFVHNFINNKKR